MKRTALLTRTPLKRGTSQLKRTRLNPRRKKTPAKERIDYAQFEFGKRETVPKPSIIYYPDGREVCNLRTPGGFDEYRRRTVSMWERQGGLCAAGEPITFMQATFDHGGLRGLAGSRRDDRIDILDEEGFYLNNCVCAEHNRKRGSKRNWKWAIRLKPEDFRAVKGR